MMIMIGSKLMKLDDDESEREKKRFVIIMQIYVNVVI